MSPLDKRIGSVGIGYVKGAWKHLIDGDRIRKAKLEHHYIMTRWICAQLSNSSMLVRWHQRMFAEYEKELEHHMQPQEAWLIRTLVAICERAQQYDGAHYGHKDNIRFTSMEFPFLVGSAMRAATDMGVREDEVIAAYMLIYPELPAA